VTRLREFISRHRAAVAIVAVAVAAFAAWRVYAAVSVGGPAPSPAPAATGAVSAPGGGPTGDAALRAAGHLTGVPAPALPGASPSAGAVGAGSPPRAPAPAATPSAGYAAVPTPAGQAAAPPGTGRADPFSPLAAPGGGPSTAVPPLPPVPPLTPGALGPSAPGAPGPAVPSATGTRGQFQLTGIMFGPSAVAILTDGADSYIVEPGDTVTPGVRVLAIDAENRTVTLASQDRSWQLRLERGGTSR